MSYSHADLLFGRSLFWFLAIQIKIVKTLLSFENGRNINVYLMLSRTEACMLLPIRREIYLGLRNDAVETLLCMYRTYPVPNAVSNPACPQ